MRLIAFMLGVPQRTVRLERGERSRNKTVRILRGRSMQRVLFNLTRLV